MSSSSATPTNPRSAFARLGVALTIAILILAAPVPGSARKKEVPLPEPKPQPVIDEADLARRIHARINEERAAHGLPALAWDAALTRVATAHSRDMAGRDYFDHNTPEGRGFTDRYRQGSYRCQVQVDNLIYGGAENIALGRLYNSVTRINGVAYHEWNSVEQIAQKTVDGWMHSSGHRKNILTPHWRLEGIGIEIHPDNKVYITQNFC
jgi:uncharacterized protein YkwD